MRLGLLLFFFTFMISIAGLTPTLTAQQVPAQPAGQAVGGASTAAPPAPLVAYEAATYPPDQAAAWEMLVHASGLGAQHLSPISVKAHYVTYDTRGKPDGEGTYLYTWVSPTRYRTEYLENGKTLWAQWETDKGGFAPPGQLGYPPYPETLLPGLLFQPLAHIDRPVYLGEETVGTTVLSCFRNTPLTNLNSTVPRVRLFRVCTVQNRPVLRLVQGDYDIVFNKIVVFQHQVLAEQINVHDDVHSVLDVEVEQIHSPTAEQLAGLDPPASAMHMTPVTLPHDVADHLLNSKVQPRYPDEMKRDRVQGTVRFMAEVSAKGEITHLQLLHSPNPSLTKAAQDAVQQWKYRPYLLNGQPVAFHCTVTVIFTMR